MAAYETITVDPLTVNIGAQVDGVDLRNPLSEQQRDEIHDALMRHLVLFFRDQDLSEDQQLAFASAFGPPVSASVDYRPGAKDVLFVSLEDNADSPPKADRWHTDVPFVPMPPDIAVLNMRATPPVGGDTLWLSLYAVHDSLSPTMQELLTGLQLDLQLGASKETILELYGEEYYREVVEPFKGAQHPLVRVHPVTGRRALYLAGSFMRGIVGHARRRECGDSRVVAVEARRSPTCSAAGGGVNTTWRCGTNDARIIVRCPITIPTTG